VVRSYFGLGQVFGNSERGGEPLGGVWGGGPMASAPRPSNICPPPCDNRRKYLIYIIKRIGYHYINIQLYKYTPTPGLYAIGLQSNGPYAISLLQYSKCITAAVLHNEDSIQYPYVYIQYLCIYTVLYTLLCCTNMEYETWHYISDNL